MDFRGRNHPAYWGFVVHRVSGVLLALFLPVHFWALGKGLEGTAALDDFLKWTDQPLVRLAEAGLVILLAVHLAGGLRILVLEFLGWRAQQKNLVAVSFAVAFICGFAFLLSAA